MVADNSDTQRNEDNAQSDKNVPGNAEEKRSPGNQRLPEMLVYHFILRIWLGIKPESGEQDRIQSQSVKT